jgi:Fe-S-cluster containining protein
MVVVGLAEAEYVYEHLSPEMLEQATHVGAERIQRIALEKNSEDFATRFFLEATPCPLLQAGACTVYTARPLACQGVLTNLDPKYCQPGAVPSLKGTARKSYQAQLNQHHGPEHYLKFPWRHSERGAQRLWAREREVRGFTIIGELASMLYLLHQPEFRQRLGYKHLVEQHLQNLGVLGGHWGFWVEN